MPELDLVFRAPRVVTAEQLNARSPGKPDHQLARRELYRGKIFTLDHDTVRFPDGSEPMPPKCSQ